MQHHESLPILPYGTVRYSIYALTACMNALAACMNGLTACMNIDRLHERVDRLHEGVTKACMNTLRRGQGRYGS